MHPLVDAVRTLPPGSCAPKVVSELQRLPDLKPEARDAISNVFMAAYLYSVKR